MNSETESRSEQFTAVSIVTCPKCKHKFASKKCHVQCSNCGKRFDQ